MEETVDFSVLDAKTELRRRVPALSTREAAALCALLLPSTEVDGKENQEGEENLPP